MATDQARREPFVGAVADRLIIEFEGFVAEDDVEATVRAARRDLEGQIVPEALGEMLHQLAHYRLTRIASSNQ